MAKGIAVVSGSNNVVFKALETGVIVAGSSTTDAVVSITGSLGVTDLVTLENGLTLTGGDLLVQAGKVSASSDLEAGGDVIAAGKVSASSDLEAGGNVVAAGNLDVEGTGNLKGKLTIQTGGLEVDAGETILADKLTVEANGAYVTGEVSASSNLKAGGNLDVEGTSDLKGKLTVEVGGADITGDVDFRDNVVIHGDLEVKGATTVTTDSVSNMRITDAVTLLGDGADADQIDIGFILGSSNSKALISDNGVFKLGSTSQTAADSVITVADDGILVLGQVTASVGILAKDVYIQDTLTVEDNVILGQDSNDTVTLNGELIAHASASFNHDVVMGTDSDDLIKVVGQIRMPIFTVSGDNNVSGYPLIPSDYVSNKAAYNGHMFFLTSSDATNWTGDDNFLQGNKWYFNERGDWHASFLFAE